MIRCSSRTTAHAINPDMAVPITSSATSDNCRICRFFNFQGSLDSNLDRGSVACCLLLPLRRCRCFCGCVLAAGSAGQASALTGKPTKQG